LIKGCDDGYNNDGCTCRRDPDTYAKDSYGRGAGTALICRPGTEQGGGLCYPPCGDGWNSDGATQCIQKCNGDFSHQCGRMCVTDGQACSSAVSSIVKDFIGMVFSGIQMFESGGTSLGSYFDMYASATSFTLNFLYDSTIFFSFFNLF